MDAAIAGHPLHPTLIPTPVGLFPASYMLDILAMLTNSDKLAEAAYYNMVIGALGAIPAALTGFSDYKQMEEKDPAHQTAMTHGLMNAGIMTIYGLNLWIRRNNKRSKLGFALSTVGTAALMVSGYLGGEIAYGRGWRVRVAERFELEWQKVNKTGPFAAKNAPEKSTKETFPPEVLKAFHEKKSGEAVFKEIKSGDAGNSFVQAEPQTATEAKPAQFGKTSQPTADLEAALPVNKPNNKPSQAEGELDTIEDDLNGRQALG